MSTRVEVALDPSASAVDNDGTVGGALLDLYDAIDDVLSRDALDHYAGGCLLFPPGRFYLSAGISIQRHGIRLVGNQTRLVFTGLDGPAISFGAATESHSGTDRSVNIGSGIEGIEIYRDVVAWDDDPLTSDDVGLALDNCQGFSAVDLGVGNFTVGLEVSASGSDLVCGGNRFELRAMVDNKVGVVVRSESETSHVVASTFVGGRFEITRTDDSGAAVEDTRHVLILGESCSNTAFYGTAFLGLPQVGVEVAGGAPAGQGELPGVHTTLFSGCWFDGEADSESGGSDDCLLAEGRGTTLTAGAVWQGMATFGEGSQPNLWLGSVVRSGSSLSAEAYGMVSLYGDDDLAMGLTVFEFPEGGIVPAPYGA